jgi:hypothetical protein
LRLYSFYWVIWWVKVTINLVKGIKTILSNRLIGQEVDNMKDPGITPGGYIIKKDPGGGGRGYTQDPGGGRKLDPGTGGHSLR